TIEHVRGVEIVNGSTPDTTLAGWRFWARLLNDGHRLVAVGGSDTHDPDGDRAIGRPTTMVFASALSEEALVAGLKQGRVYVRSGEAHGPSVDLQAQSGSRSTSMGGIIPAGRLRLTAVLAEAGGQECVWIRRGTAIRTDPIRLRRTATTLEVEA